MLNETFSVIFKHRVLLHAPKDSDLQILILLKRVVSQPAIFARYALCLVLFCKHHHLWWPLLISKENLGYHTTCMDDEVLLLLGSSRHYLLFSAIAAAVLHIVEPECRSWRTIIEIFSKQEVPIVKPTNHSISPSTILELYNT